MSSTNRKKVFVWKLLECKLTSVGSCQSSSMHLKDVSIVLFAFPCFISAITLKDHFTQTSLTDIDFGAFSTNKGDLDLLSCSLACLNDENCVAFHMASTDICFYVTKRGIMWLPKDGAPSVQLWIRFSKLISSCSAEKFPRNLGISRYRVVKEVKQNWTAAAEYCKNINGYLAELTSNSERSFTLTDFGLESEWAHISLRQEAGSEEPGKGWKWYTSGLPLATTEGWHLSEPNDLRNKEDGRCRCPFYRKIFGHRWRPGFSFCIVWVQYYLK